MKKAKEENNHPITWEQIGNFILILICAWCITSGIIVIVHLVQLHFNPQANCEYRGYDYHNAGDGFINWIY